MEAHVLTDESVSGPEERPDRQIARKNLWQKGTSPNPGGVPATIKKAKKELAADLLPVALKTLKRVMLKGSDRDAVAAAQTVVRFCIAPPKAVSGGAASRILPALSTELLARLASLDARTVDAVRTSAAAVQDAEIVEASDRVVACEDGSTGPEHSESELLARPRASTENQPESSESEPLAAPTSPGVATIPGGVSESEPDPKPSKP